MDPDANVPPPYHSPPMREGAPLGNGIPSIGFDQTLPININQMRHNLSSTMDPTMDVLPLYQSPPMRRGHILGMVFLPSDLTSLYPSTTTDCITISLQPAQATRFLHHWWSSSVSHHLKKAGHLASSTTPSTNSNTKPPLLPISTTLGER